MDMKGGELSKILQKHTGSTVVSQTLQTYFVNISLSSCLIATIQISIGSYKTIHRTCYFMLYGIIVYMLQCGRNTADGNKPLHTHVVVMLVVHTI